MNSPGYVPSIDAFEAQWLAAPDAIAVIDPHLLARFRADKLPMLIVGTAAGGIVIKRSSLHERATP